MKIKTITISDNENHPGALRLKKSLDKFGYDYEHIFAPFQFGCQMPVIYRRCKDNRVDYSHILYSDCFDTVALAPVEELLKKVPKDVLFFGSAEKACYPDPELASQYPETEFHWKYVNGGNWLCSVELFIEMYEKYPTKDDYINDQLWLSHRYLELLKDKRLATLDYHCEVYQSIAFEATDDFALTRNNRLLNRKTGSLPIFLHGNGGGDMTWLNPIL